MQIIEALKALYGYPVPEDQIKLICTQRELYYQGEASPSVVSSENFQLAKADLLKWIATAPNVKELDVSINLDSNDRKILLNNANAIYGQFQENNGRVVFGYKGENL